jgi:hypothetical protein
LPAIHIPQDKNGKELKKDQILYDFLKTKKQQTAGDNIAIRL